MNCPSCQAENEAFATACATCGTSLETPTALVVSVDLSPGTLFDSRYEILGPLGRGGMGMVYKARDRTLDEIVAIKVLRPDFAQDPKMAERFKSEIKLARKVRHKNVCAIHDYGEDRGLLYISMEMVEGVDLKRILKEAGGLPHPEAYDIAIQVAEGLQAVHEAGIIHRDLKTPNIMRDSRGVARLMDFGIAKREGGGGGGASTATGHILGTPEYMSPEQAQGQKVDFRSDIYALGVVIYEIFTGHVPFRGDTPISTILKHLHDAPPLEGAAGGPIPADLRQVLRKSLAKDPAERYATARDLAEGLRDARSPSRRQQLLATGALRAPTLPGVAAAGRGWRLAPWLAGVSVVVGIAAFLAWPRARPVETIPSPSPSAPPTTASATVAAVAPSLSVAAPSPSHAPAAASVTPSQPPRPRSTPPAQRAMEMSTPAASPSPPAALPPSSNAEVAVGLLQVAVRPWAEVSVDGNVVGTTPLDRISLSPGVHRIRVQHPAYEPVERSVKIRSGETAKLTVDLPNESTRKQP
jgi:protein kinase-like protein/PEGA domain-containing protein